MNINPAADVNFPAFTSSLIQGVFETIQNNHLMQIQSYTDLLAATSLSVEDFATENAFDVPDIKVYDFLQQPFDLRKSTTAVTAPADYITIDEWLQIGSAPLTDLSSESYTALTALLKVGDTGPIFNNSKDVDYLMLKVREKLATKNYQALKEMVQMGMQRIVTDEILIKTRLRFKASDRSFDTSSGYQSKYGKKAFNVGGNAYYKGKKFGVSISAGYSSVKTTVNTTSNSSQNSSNADLNLMGYVKIKAHTDYKPLSS